MQMQKGLVKGRRGDRVRGGRQPPHLRREREQLEVADPPEEWVPRT